MFKLCVLAILFIYFIVAPVVYRDVMLIVCTLACIWLILFDLLLLCIYQLNKLVDIANIKDVGSSKLLSIITVRELYKIMLKYNYKMFLKILLYALVLFLYPRCLMFIVELF